MKLIKSAKSRWAAIFGVSVLLTLFNNCGGSEFRALHDDSVSSDSLDNGRKRPPPAPAPMPTPDPAPAPAPTSQPAAIVSKFPLPQPTDANVYVVDAMNGNDSNPGTDAKPWKTFQSHFNTFNGPGKTVFLKNGTYITTGTLSFCQNGYQGKGGGQPGSPMIIAAYPGQKPVFDGQNKAGLWALLCNNVGNLVISGLKFVNMRPGDDGLITAVGRNDNVIIEFNEFENIGNVGFSSHVIYLGGQETEITGASEGQLNWKIRSNKASDVAGGFLHVYHAGPLNTHDIVVENNVVTNATWAVILSRGGVSKFTIQNNTFYDVGFNSRNQVAADAGQFECNYCRGAGIDLDLSGGGTMTQNIIIRGNVIMARSGGRAFASPIGSGFKDEYNVWGSVDNQAKPIAYPSANQSYMGETRLSVADFIKASAGRGLGSLQVNPLNLLNVDLTLKAGAVAIDFAQTSIVTNDILMNARKGTPDAGALEY